MSPIVCLTAQSKKGEVKMKPGIIETLTTMSVPWYWWLFRAWFSRRK
jgi:hypothetical protein